MRRVQVVAKRQTNLKSTKIDLLYGDNHPRLSGRAWFDELFSLRIFRQT